MGKFCLEVFEFVEWYVNGVMNKISIFIKYSFIVLCICKSKMIKYL